MTISTPISSIIDSLDQSNDPAVAYFSFVADDSGEHGAIRANKEGLRRFALELLKKSVEMEETRDTRSLCFPAFEWVVSDAGYDLIRSVKPEYASRTEILASGFHPDDMLLTTGRGKRKGCLGMVMWIAVGLGTAAALVSWIS